MARSFNGSTDVITSSTFAVPTAATLSVWVNTTSLAATYECAINWNNGTTFFQIFIKSTGKIAYYANCTGGTSGADPGSATISTNTWTHLAVSCDSSIGLIGYFNGVSDGTVVPNGTIRTGTTGIVIGNDPINAGRFFSGSLADGAVWNLSLSATEILSLSKGARPYKIRPSSLLGWWPVDGLQSPEPDLSGFAHNGTLTGTAKAFGPPIMPFTPRWPQGISSGAGPAPGTVFRRTLSALGTRTGSRQVQGLSQ